MNSLSNSNTLNHCSHFGSPLHANSSEENKVVVLANIKDNKLVETSKYQNETVALNNVWTKGTFSNRSKSKPDLSLSLPSEKITWNSQHNNNNNNNNNDNQVDLRSEEDDKYIDVATNDVNIVISPTPDNESTSPSHHARRPMNAFLIFCKKHRPIVRRKFPSLENRGVTRILGEWWALLDENDKKPYKDLAKEYKDAFFSANPDFKWYKLPAPPLRTLATRPNSAQKDPIHIAQSPTQINALHESEFTPGKLADESQLGSLSALLNVSHFPKSSDVASKIDVEETKDVDNQNDNCNYNNNVEVLAKSDPCLESPPALVKDIPIPPKPIKKRKFVENLFENSKTSVRNIFNTEQIYISESQPELKHAKLELTLEEHSSQDNEVNKELIKQIVDNTCQNQNLVPQNCSSFSNSDLNKEPRKSGRSCKGKLYAEFMMHGKLIKNKREKRCNSFDAIKKDEDDYNTSKSELKPDSTSTFDLQNTIKRLAERTKVNLAQIEEDRQESKEIERIRTNSESSEDSFIKNKFDLQKRIDDLPSLDYDNYMQRKKENKKKKINKAKSVHMSNHQKQKLQNSISSSVNINNNNVPIGSKKRKNKLSITHLEKKDPHLICGNADNIVNEDLSGLATLAEIASNKEKLNQDKVLL